MPSQLTHKSHWRKDGTCSYCGSLSPELFFKAIEDKCELGPTDKNYKVYVDRPDPEAGIPWIYGSANFEQTGKGWTKVTSENLEELQLVGGHQSVIGEWVEVSVKSKMHQDKFYFQHLTEAEMHLFIDLLKRDQLKIGYPGYFYQLPFFIRKGAD